MSNTEKMGSNKRFNRVSQLHAGIYFPIKLVFLMSALLLSSATLIYSENAQPASATSPTWSTPIKIIPNAGGGNLYSVSCPSATFCMAVDEYGYALNFNGSTWSSPLSVDPKGILSSVSCPTTTFCAAVDGSGYEVNFNGSTWSSPLGIDSNGTLSSVSCPSATFCEAVDYNGNALNFNGSTWSSPLNIDPGRVLDSVSCPSATFCMAVDDKGNALTYGGPIQGSPLVTGITPSSGPTTGGTSVTITGSNFSGATAVDFGSNPATSFTINSSTSITATSPAGSGKVDITVTTSSGVSSVVSADAFVYISSNPYHSLTPTRICDTRVVQTGVSLNECNSGGTKTLSSGTVLDIPVVGQDSIPSNATAVVANVTVTNTTSAGYLTVFPGGESTPPTASNLNWASGGTVANLVTVALGPNGDIEAYNFEGSADVIVDIAGYYGPDTTGNAGLYVPVTPSRICDTRPVQVGVVSNQCNSGSNGPIGPGQTLTVNVFSQGGLPGSGISAVALNLTAIDPTSPGYLTLYPTGGTLPTVSNVNFVANQIVPNRVIVKLTSSGTISIYNPYGTTNIAIDINGYFTDGTSTPTGASSFMPITPTRICDTRAIQVGVSSNQCNSGGSGTLSTSSTKVIQVSSIDGLPSNITAVVANVTVTDTTSSSFLSLYPGGNLPTVSDLNWVQGDTLANLAQITLSSGSFSTYNFNGSVDVMVDISGYFAP